ncbi:MAG TPA: hypothetical protein VH593_01830 [Ktedonobacteraceae bacterium]
MINPFKDLKEIIPGFWCSRDMANDIIEIMTAETRRLLATEGKQAIEQPKSAACAHETGHAIIHAALGQKVKRVEITYKPEFKFMVGHNSWGGFTSIHGGKWVIQPDSPLEDVFGRICIIIAGVAAELILDPAGSRKGSSLDEVVVGQYLAGQLHNRENYHSHESQTWNACWSWTCAVIKYNEDVARKLIAKLDLIGSVQGKPLADIMSRVRKPPRDWIQQAIKKYCQGTAPLSPSKD